jgi:hypothetical protein
MNEAVIKELTPMAAIIVIAVFLVKGMFELFKNKDARAESKTDRLIEALQTNTIAVTALTVRMEYLEKKLEAIPGIEKDLAKLGQKVRDISK